MKMHFDWTRHTPPGWDWENLRFSLMLGHGASVLPLLTFLSRYHEARRALYDYVRQDGGMIPVLNTERVIAPFAPMVLGTPLLGFGVFLLMMALQVLRHYRYHSQDSMSIYLMRRLPDRWELHRRCWTVPVLACLAELVLMAGMIFLCWLYYRFATPAPCLR